MSDTPRPENRLAHETSAYLRQHMHNPVDWYPWGEEAQTRAREEDRPLLVSIGYSACHWCHVMERESFENPETAALMNASFVNVKVDREERPDVDQIYMETVLRMQGQGGWPLTVFCTSDGRPFYAGTYFPPEPRHGMPAFPELLRAIAETWRTRRGEVDETAARVLAALRQRPSGVASALPGREQLLATARELFGRADRQHGGLTGGPKFPTPTSLEVWLLASELTHAEEAGEWLDFMAFSCREMSRRGLYDQLGGGFHRYCVDDHWGVPHFEKMLYDQGQLLRVYAETWRRRGADDEDLLWPIRETAAYLAREMTGPEGGLLASQDADSEGVEGRFYVWRPSEVEAVLEAPAAARFCETYGVRAGGNFEDGATVLWDLARAPRAELSEEREKLRLARAERVWPGTDTKRVAAWNGLTISGLALAGSLLPDESLLAAARRAADFVWDAMRDENGGLLRVHCDGKARISAFLDDWAAMLTAFLDLHRAGAGEAYLDAAVSCAEAIEQRFFDVDEQDLFLTPADGERLPHRPRSDSDGATPHSTGLATLGLLRVASLTGREGPAQVAQRVLRTHAFVLERAGQAYPTLLRAAALSERGLSCVVVAGAPDDPATHALALRARRVLGPEDAVLLGATAEGSSRIDRAWLEGRETRGGTPTAYVCRGTTCSLPITEPDALDDVEALLGAGR